MGRDQIDFRSSMLGVTRRIPAVIANTVICGVDWMRDPPENPHPWALVPVRIIEDRGIEIEVEGLRYVQDRNDKPIKTIDTCRWCVVVWDERLCNVMCPYCRAGYVFKIKKEGADPDGKL